MAMLNNQMVIPIAVVYDTSNCFFFGVMNQQTQLGGTTLLSSSVLL